MDIKCPHCGTEYDAEESEYGRFVKCEVCGKGFVAGTSGAKKHNEMIGATRSAASTDATREQETTILRLKPSLAPIIAKLVVFSVPLLPFSLMFLFGDGLTSTARVVGIIFFVVPGVIVGLVLLTIGLIYSGTEYIFTNKRLIVKSGVITESVRKVHVQDMRDIFLTRGLFQCLTGTGSISIGSQTTGILARIAIVNIAEYARAIEILESLKEG